MQTQQKNKHPAKAFWDEQTPLPSYKITGLGAHSEPRTILSKCGLLLWTEHEQVLWMTIVSSTMARAALSKETDKCQDQIKNAAMQVIFKKFQKIRNNMILQLNIV